MNNSGIHFVEKLTEIYKIKADNHIKINYWNKKEKKLMDLTSKEKEMGAIIYRGVDYQFIEGKDIKEEEEEEEKFVCMVIDPMINDVKENMEGYPISVEYKSKTEENNSVFNYIGFLNNYNTSYIGSILSILSHCNKFRDELNKIDETENGHKELKRIVEKCYLLFDKEMNNNKNITNNEIYNLDKDKQEYYVDITEFKKAYNLSLQPDGNENVESFLIFLINKLNLKKMINICSNSNEDTDILVFHWNGEDRSIEEERTFNDEKYILKGFVVCSIEKHYISYIKENDNWYEYNDYLVTYVGKDTHNVRTDEICCVFYEKEQKERK